MQHQEPNDFTNKLLVLIDGRTIYKPLFAGVTWETQETTLEDIERIEVIRGLGRLDRESMV